MAVCLVPVTDGSGVITGLRPDPSIADLSSCAYVAQSGPEYSQGFSAVANMSIEDAGVISVYIGTVWAIAWGFRMIAKTVMSNWSDSNE